ncbi:MAG: patatin-like phospholipase family protein [Planctomycetota bacterium]
MGFLGKSKVVLALGGGGSRGLAHLGVLQALEEADISIDGIVGTSVGSIVGAAYASHPNAKELTESSLAYVRSPDFMKDQFRRLMFGANDVDQNFLQTVFKNIKRSLTFSSLIRKQAIFEGDRLRGVVEDLVPDRKFEDLEIPFAVPAIDLRPPMEVLLTTGSLRDAVTASCSLPGFFPPVELDGMLLADVGVIGCVPVHAARQMVSGAMVIAVDISSELDEIEEIGKGWESIMRVESIASKKLSELELSAADVVLRPDCGHKYWSDFSGLDAMVESGRRAALDRIEEIRSKSTPRWLPFRK